MGRILMAILGSFWIAVIGGVLVWISLGELSTYRRSSPEPRPALLEDIEADRQTYDPHMALGPHYQVMDLAVFRYRGRGEPTPESALEEVYVPIISGAHPYIRELARLQDQFGSLDKVPESVPFPTLETFSMVLRTRSIKRLGDLPTGLPYSEGASGLVINEIDPLRQDERELLLQSNPKLDLEELLILDLGRAPQSPTTSYALGGLGAALCLFALYRVVRAVRAQREATETYTPAEPSP